MPATRDARGRWFYRKMVKLPDGRKLRVSGVPEVNTKAAALREEELHIARLKNPEAERKEVPKFDEWFNGRFWDEWVIGRKNKPSSQEEKRGIFDIHLQDAFGALRLNEIKTTEIAQFRAKLVRAQLSEKRINNILAVLSKALRYAVDVELIDHAPKVGLFRVERPEISFWSFDEYARLLAAAEQYGPEWYAAACLAGEAGLRVGEVKALKWREHVDLIAGTITVAQQIRHGVMGTPKGRTRRTVPMTATLLDALKRLDVVRTGYVVRSAEGSPKSDNQAEWAITAICNRAGLCTAEKHKWHRLRHTFGTHAAQFGVNPWTLMTWMGHKRVDETMLYVHVAQGHRRPLADDVLAAGRSEPDPDLRVLAMLSARRGSHVAAKPKIVSNYS
jgi:integrase